jgi:hypothetical protein
MRNIQISNKLENNMGGDNPNREAISKGGAHFFFFVVLVFCFFPPSESLKIRNQKQNVKWSKELV